MTNLPSLNQLILEIQPSIQQKAWKQSQKAATSSSRWQTYLNQLALDTFINYAREEQSETVARETKFDRVEELVNGVALKIGNVRLVLIPSEAEDLEELRVAKEWIDIPQWVADYYLAVQVNVDDNYIRLWGYTTHQTIKNKGNYDASDRYYSLNNIDIIDDISVFWVARELCPNEVTRAKVATIQEIDPQQANNLIQRLGNSANLLPRLSIPFTTWAGAISNDTWRNRLIAKRRGQTKISIIEYLKAEASNIASTVLAETSWQRVEFQFSTAVAKGKTTAERSKQALAKRLTIGDRSYELKVIEVDKQTNTYGFELRNISTTGAMIPAGFLLRLLTETGEEFAGNEDVANTAVESLYLEVALDSGEGLIWEIEPTPEDYQTEVLYF